MSQDNSVKLYIRYDFSGRAIASSGVLRKSKPKAGTWKEFSAYECCNPAQNITATPGAVSGNDWDFSLSCSGGGSISLFIPGGAITDIDSLVDFLNLNIGYLGVFTTDGTDITLAIILSIAQQFCSDTITMSIQLD